MSEEEYQTQVKQISDGLTSLFVGKDKMLSIVACLSIAATTAHMIGLSKLACQEILIRSYDKRVAEDLSQ